MESLFRKLTLEMCDGDAIEVGLHRSLLLLREHLPIDRASLTATGIEDRSFARVVAEADASGGWRSELLVAMAKEAIEFVGAIRSDDVMIINRPDEHPLYKRIMPDVPGQKKTGAIMLAPLGIGTRPVGALTVFSEAPDCYTEQHASLLRSVHVPFAVALAHWVHRDRFLQLQNQLLEDRHELEKELWGKADNVIVGENFGLKAVMEQLRRVALSPSPVLLLGETGVGKDVLANALHRGSGRSGPFVKMNCGAVSEGLVDSELFGHEAGSFTGARVRHRGRFERAQGGTLFLDEIGELPPAVQLRLLRVLQHGEFERVGGSDTVKIDVRIVAATHRDLKAMVAKGQFREDLWFRLNVFPILVPPLRERREDIPVLVHHIIRHKAASLRKGSTPELAPGALDALLSYDWPGNVRELENVLERALIVHESGPLHVEPRVRPPAPQAPGGGAPVAPEAVEAVAEPERIQTLDELVAAHIRMTLERTGGKIHGPGGAAELLGVQPTTLRNRMDKLGVSYLKRVREAKS